MANVAKGGSADPPTFPTCMYHRVSGEVRLIKNEEQWAELDSDWQDSPPNPLKPVAEVVEEPTAEPPLELGPVPPLRSHPTRKK